MKESEVKEFFRLYKELDNIGKEVFEQFHEANLLSSDICCPAYEGIDFNNSNNSILFIRYFDKGYDIYDADTISIPFDFIINNKVCEYIEEKRRKLEEWEEAQKKVHDEYLLNLEKSEYERLKAKFEK